MTDDSLSPIIFDMVVDNLSKLIEKKVGERKIDIYKMNGATSISHLMYANDVLFTKANPKSLNAIKGILDVFSKFSGLEINRDKRVAVYSKVCSEDGTLYSVLGFPSKVLPIVYLRIPITRKKKAFRV